MPTIFASKLARASCTSLLCAAIWTSAAAAETTGYTVAEGELRRVDLSDGSYQTIGPTGIPSPSTLGLVLLDDGYFYGLGEDPQPPFLGSLYRFDRATGAGELVGPPAALAGHWSIAGAGDGALYTIDGTGTIYRVDKTTAVATALVTIHVFADAFFGDGGELFLVERLGSQLGCLLRRFEVATQVLEKLGPIRCSNGGAVGEDGYIYQSVQVGGIIPPPGEPQWEMEVWRYDLASGESNRFGNWVDVAGKSQIFGLAAVQGGDAVDVPATGSAGLLLLAAGLAATGLIALPRR